MKRKVLDSQLRLLTQIVDEAYDRPAWHGANLRGSLRGVTARQAAWRPAPNRHSIWEVAIHAAYWKYIVRRRISGDRGASFPFEGRNWFRAPAVLDEKNWNGHLALLDDQHQLMRDLIEQLPDWKLHRRSAGHRQSHFTLIFGIAAHDIYHAGQIQLLKRLQSSLSA